MITVPTPSSRARSMISAQKARQRMFGSMPRTRMRSCADPGGRQRVSRVVGQSMARLTPSTIRAVGRDTWKS